MKWIDTLDELIMALQEETIHINELIHLCNNNYWDIKANPNNNSKLNEFAIIENNQHIIINVDFETGNVITFNKAYSVLLDKEIDVPIYFFINKGIPFIKHPRRK